MIRIERRIKMLATVLIIAISVILVAHIYVTSKSDFKNIKKRNYSQKLMLTNQKGASVFPYTEILSLIGVTLLCIYIANLLIKYQLDQLLSISSTVLIIICLIPALINLIFILARRSVTLDYSIYLLGMDSFFNWNRVKKPIAMSKMDFNKLPRKKQWQLIHQHCE